MATTDVKVRLVTEANHWWNNLYELVLMRSDSNKTLQDVL